MFNVACTFPAELALKLRSLDPIFLVSYNPRNFMWWFSIQNVPSADAPPETWAFQNLLSWKGSPTSADLATHDSCVQFWTSFRECVAEPWKSIADALPASLENINFTCDTANLWTPKSWSDSSLSPYVTLAGDAAHPFPPFRGQGLNNALEDAARLVGQLIEVKEGRKNLKQGVEAYEEEMIARAQRKSILHCFVLVGDLVHRFLYLLSSSSWP
jgi:2-polyprenyl-6-methoxyphenol hydroxylase-like FAD-dependent oxidoreductase